MATETHSSNYKILADIDLSANDIINISKIEGNKAYTNMPTSNLLITSSESANNQNIEIRTQNDGGTTYTGKINLFAGTTSFDTSKGISLSPNREISIKDNNLKLSGSTTLTVESTSKVLVQSTSRIEVANSSTTIQLGSSTTPITRIEEYASNHVEVSSTYSLTASKGTIQSSETTPNFKLEYTTQSSSIKVTDLTVTRDTTISRNTTISGTLHTVGDTTLDNNLILTNSSPIINASTSNSVLTVKGTTVRIQGNGDTTTSYILNGSSTTNTELKVNKIVVAKENSGNLTVNAPSTFNNTVSVSTSSTNVDIKATSVSIKPANGNSSVTLTSTSATVVNTTTTISTTNFYVNGTSSTITGTSLDLASNTIKVTPSTEFILTNGTTSGESDAKGLYIHSTANGSQINVTDVTVTNTLKINASSTSDVLTVTSGKTNLRDLSVWDTININNSKGKGYIKSTTRLDIASPTVTIKGTANGTTTNSWFYGNTSDSKVNVNDVNASTVLRGGIDYSGDTTTSPLYVNTSNVYINKPLKQSTTSEFTQTSTSPTVKITNGTTTSNALEVTSGITELKNTTINSALSVGSTSSIGYIYGKGTTLSISSTRITLDTTPTPTSGSALIYKDSTTSSLNVNFASVDTTFKGGINSSGTTLNSPLYVDKNNIYINKSLSQSTSSKFEISSTSNATTVVTITNGNTATTALDVTSGLTKLKNTSIDNVLTVESTSTSKGEIKSTTYLDIYAPKFTLGVSKDGSTSTAVLYKDANASYLNVTTVNSTTGNISTVNASYVLRGGSSNGTTITSPLYVNTSNVYINKPLKQSTTSEFTQSSTVSTVKITNGTTTSNALEVTSGKTSLKNTSVDNTLTIGNATGTGYIKGIGTTLSISSSKITLDTTDSPSLANAFIYKDSTTSSVSSNYVNASTVLRGGVNSNGTTINSPLYVDTSNVYINKPISQSNSSKFEISSTSNTTTVVTITNGNTATTALDVTSGLTKLKNTSVDNVLTVESASTSKGEIKSTTYLDIYAPKFTLGTSKDGTTATSVLYKDGTTSYLNVVTVNSTTGNISTVNASSVLRGGSSNGTTITSPLYVNTSNVYINKPLKQTESSEFTKNSNSSSVKISNTDTGTSAYALEVSSGKTKLKNLEVNDTITVDNGTNGNITSSKILDIYAPTLKVHGTSNSTTSSALLYRDSTTSYVNANVINAPTTLRGGIGYNGGITNSPLYVNTSNVYINKPLKQTNTSEFVSTTTSDLVKLTNNTASSNAVHITSGVARVDTKIDITDSTLSTTHSGVNIYWSSTSNSLIFEAY